MTAYEIVHPAFPNLGFITTAALQDCICFISYVLVGEGDALSGCKDDCFNENGFFCGCYFLF